MLRLMLREATLPRTLVRTPEPTAAMASAESIAGFDEQGGLSLLPIYRFNALAIHRLAPRGAQIVDLGCGTGRFLAYLAAHRPDLKIVGLDFAEEMVRIGRCHLARAGLDGRVRLLPGDMREFRKVVPAGADLVTSIFSLHHLTTRDDLLACLRETAAAIESEHPLLWIFDHVRPRRQRTAEDVPEIFTPDASPAFCDDFPQLAMCLLELRRAVRGTARNAPGRRPRGAVEAASALPDSLDTAALDRERWPLDRKRGSAADRSERSPPPVAAVSDDAGKARRGAAAIDRSRLDRGFCAVNRRENLQIALERGGSLPRQIPSNN